MKVRLPLWGKPQGYATLDTEATKGATLGVNVYRADGSVVTEADLVPAAAEPAAPTRTLWSLLTGIPDLLVSLLALATDGFVRKSGSAFSASAIVNADLPSMATKTIKGRKTGSTGAPQDCTLSEVLDFIGSATKGDILVRDTSGWVRLAAPATGLVLTGNGAGALPTYQAPSGGGSGAMTLVGTATVAGSAATTLTLSSLDLATDGEYVIEFAAANATASVATISVYFNGDTTASNYWRQTTTANSGISGSRASDAAMFSMLASGYATGKMCAFTGRDGRANLMLDYNRSGAGSILTQHQGMEYQTVANVTSIALSSSVANSLAVGTYFKVWKVN